MRWSLASLAAVTLLAAALRWFRIDAQSLWYDEGISAHQLTRSFGEIVHAAALDTHPPLYYWTLKAWGEAVGASELGLRSLSAVGGVVAVVLTWLLGRRLFGPLVAMLAAVLLAAAPLAVYYSQEVRMYAQVTALGLLAVLAYTCSLRPHAGSVSGAAGAWSSSSLGGNGRERAGQHGAGLRGFVGAGEHGAGLRGFVAGNGWYALYVLAAAATLYTQYLGAAFLVAVNLHALAWWRRRSLADWARWLGANAAAALVFVPWLPTFVEQQSHALNTSPRTPSGLALHTLEAYGGGVARGDVLVWGGAALVGLALVGALASLLAGARRGPSTQGVTQGVTQSVTSGAKSVTSPAKGVTRDEQAVTWPEQGVTWGEAGVTWAEQGVTPGGGALAVAAPPLPVADPLRAHIGPAIEQSDAREPMQPAPLVVGASLALLIWLVPLGLVLYLGLRSGLFEVRYLLLSMPGLCLLAAAGLAALTRRPPLAVLGTAALLVPAAQGLSAQYFDPALARDDYRGVVQAIQAQAQPTDAIVLSAPNQVEVFEYYYHGSLPVIGLPAQRPIDPQDTQARLAALKQTYGRVWLVEWAIDEADPPGVMLTWLAQNGFQASHAWYGSVQLALIGFGSADAPLHQLHLPLSNGITLEGYQLPSDTLRPGDTLQLTLLWRAGTGPTQQRWKVFTHVLDQSSQVAAQRDAEPGDTLRPTTTWQAGEDVRDNYGISLPPDLAAGDYTLEIGMYDGETRATFAGHGNHLDLGTIHVRR